MKKLFVYICCLLLLTSIKNYSFAQKNNLENKKSSNLPQIKNLSEVSNLILPKKFWLFNPERFKMSHAYSVFYSSGRFGGVKGLYENTINYKISDKLEMRFHFGYLFQPGFMNSYNKNYSGFNKGIFLPNFDLKYKPSENTFFGISFRSYTPSLLHYPYYYNYYRDGFYDNRYWFW